MVTDGAWQQYMESIETANFFGDHLTLIAIAEVLERELILHSGVPGGKSHTVTTRMPDNSTPRPPIEIGFLHEGPQTQAEPEAAGPAADNNLGSDDCSACGAIMLQGDCWNPQCHANPDAKMLKRITGKSGPNHPAWYAPRGGADHAAVARPEDRTAATPEAARTAAMSQPQNRSKARSQVKQCSRCHRFGCRMDSLQCPMRNVPVNKATQARWLKKKKPVPSLELAKVDPKATTSKQRSAELKALVDQQGMTRKAPDIERREYDPAYTREVSPGRKAQKRIELRRITDPHVVLDRDNNEAAALRALIDLGFLVVQARIFDTQYNLLRYNTI